MSASDGLPSDHILVTTSWRPIPGVNVLVTTFWWWHHGGHVLVTTFWQPHPDGQVLTAASWLPCPMVDTFWWPCPCGPILVTTSWWPCLGEGIWFYFPLHFLNVTTCLVFSLICCIVTLPFLLLLLINKVSQFTKWVLLWRPLHIVVQYCKIKIYIHQYLISNTVDIFL